MTSRTRRHLGLAALALALPLVSPITGWTQPAGTHDHSGLEHHTIRIRERRIAPENAEVASANAVAWVNYTADVLVVSFDESVADNLVCMGPSNFTLSGGRLVSKPLRANEFASVCMFKPGTYSYRVDMIEIAQSGPPNLAKPLEAKLVVQ